ncbi:MAG: outer membrane protein assembly factor BamA [Treponema sp.]|nr:outer membrane protein assembly factor BamA [Candidatus Treponema equifaecale]
MSFRKILTSIFACLMLSCIPVSVVAQDAAAASELEDGWYYGKLIKSVTFKGLKNVAAKDVDGIVSSYYGKKFSDELYEDMFDRIYALDYFDDFSSEVMPADARHNTLAITITVTEKPSISRIIIKGNREIRTTEIKEAISIKEKDIYKAPLISSDERAIRNHYLEKGFTNVRVTSETKEGSKGYEVTFVIDEGRSTVVGTINFIGNRVVSSKTLKKKISLKEVGIISKGAFQESMLEADRQAILAYYSTDGYIDAEVVDIKKEVTVNEAKNRDELTITFAIQEGSQYLYNGCSFVGNKIFTDADLNSYIKLKKGAVFNQTKFNEGIMAVADHYYENGYTANRFQQIPLKDPENKTISYQFMIMENVRSHVESVTIKGNTKTKDHVIRREIPLESGDIFSKAKVTTGLRNLYNLQYFSAVVPDIVPGSEENLVDLIVSVEEQSTTSIEFGVTFSGVSDPDDLPFALFVKWQDSNIKGTGNSISASSTIATDSQSLGLSFGSNWLFDKPISTSISSEISHSSLSALRNKIDSDGLVDSDSYYMDYEQLKWTSGFSLGRRWTPDFAILSLAAGVNFSLKNNMYDEDLWNPYDSTVSEYANKWGWSNSVWTSFSIDDRDINYDPSSGWFASQRFTWYGITPFEEEYFLRSDTKLEKYFTLFKVQATENWMFKLVLMAYSGLSMQFPAFGSGIGDSSRLYIDGMFNGRGWTSIYNTNRGKAMWSNILELRIPVVPGVLALDIFGDAAVVKDEVDELKSLEKTDFFFSFGPGLRFTIPQFPLRLLFANTGKFGSVDSADHYGKGDGSWNWKDNWKFVLSFNITNK